MIKKLEIQNVKGIRHVAIHALPVNEISGQNGAGKSTILDSIAFALAGRDFVDKEALRAGEEHGFVAIDTDDFRIERHFDKEDQKGRLIVKASGKNKMTQSNLDTMINTATFDPVAFSRASGKEKIELAKKILTEDQRSDLSNFEIAITKMEEDRLFKGREIKALGEPVEPIEEEKTVENSADLHDLLADLLTEESAHEKKLIHAEASVNSLRASFSALKSKISDCHAEIDNMMRKIADKKSEICNLEAEAEGLEVEGKKAAKELEKAKESKPDNKNKIDEIKARIADRDSAIEVQRKWKEFRTKTAEIRTKQIDYETLSARIRDTRERRAKILAEALGEGFDFDFDTGTIRKNGVIFDQLSQAEKIVAACQILFRTNPKIKVVCVRDGSLLDSRSTADLVAICKESGFQLWIETVGSGNSEDAIVIEEGGLKL